MADHDLADQVPLIALAAGQPRESFQAFLARLPGAFDREGTGQPELAEPSKVYLYLA